VSTSAHEGEAPAVTRVELERSGGFAGLSLRASVDTAGDQPEAAWVEEALSGVDLAALAGEPSPPAPDRFVYRLAVDRDGQRHEMAFGEQDLPAALRPLVERLLHRARGGAPPPSGPAQDTPPE
jgi:hypothetical protein